MSSNHKWAVAAAAGFFAGIAALELYYRLSGVQRVSETVGDGDDGFNSLYYTQVIEPEGRGNPTVGKCDPETLAQLRRVEKDYRFLPKEFYSTLCESTVITCVDIIVQRRHDNKILLFYRRDPPAAQIWWWPGGRLFRGESFQDAALRKVKDETGGRCSKVEAKGVVTVWNTFFPDSAWDKGRSVKKRGTQTMNVVVACVCDDQAGVSEGGQVSQWAVDAQRWVSVDEALQPGAYDKYVRLNVLKARQLGLLL